MAQLAGYPGQAAGPELAQPSGGDPFESASSTNGATGSQTTRGAKQAPFESWCHR